MNQAQSFLTDEIQMMSYGRQVLLQQFMKNPVRSKLTIFDEVRCQELTSGDAESWKGVQ